MTAQLAFDFTQSITPAKVHRGHMSYLAGAAAEDSVARDYVRRGYSLAAQRWSGADVLCGEIDLIIQDGDGLIFVEVKKSSSFERAIERITPTQMHRIMASASEYLAKSPLGQLTDVRFDVAVVNQHGEIRIVENAFGAF